MNNHSFLPPSSAARRVACPGSRRLESMYPELSNLSDAQEGIDAHHVASEYLRSRLTSDLKTISGKLVTQEMIDGAKLYYDFVDKLKGWDYRLHIEEKIDISCIYPGCFGTPDLWWRNEDTGALIIADYKFGFNFVDVFENWQLIEYAAGILDYLQYDVTEIDFYIIQLRSFHRLNKKINRWSISKNEFIDYFKKLRRAEHESMLDDAVCIPSPQCTYCVARRSCDALQKESLTAVDISQMGSITDLSSTQLGNELRYLKRAEKLLSARISGLSEQAVYEIRSGNTVPFFRLEASNGREKWTADANEIIALGNLLQCNLSKPAEVITPKQAINLGMPEEVIKKYSQLIPGEMKLVQHEKKDIERIFELCD